MVTAHASVALRLMLKVPVDVGVPATIA